jgi:hypothetical protein
MTVVCRREDHSPYCSSEVIANVPDGALFLRARSRLETSNKASTAPELDGCPIDYLLGPYDCIIIVCADEAALPSQLSVFFNRNNAIIIHLATLQIRAHALSTEPSSSNNRLNDVATLVSNNHVR